MIAEYLLKACDVVERGALVENLRRVLFTEGRLRAFNGLVEYQAPSGLDPALQFSLNEAKLASALRACGPALEASMTDQFMRLKSGPLNVRVRKMPHEGLHYERINMPAEAANQMCDDLLLALRAVRPFISSDASRPWSVAAKIKDGYAWATNNLALVRTPLAAKLPEMTIPLPAVELLCDFPSLDHWHVDDQQRLVFSIGRQLVRCPQSTAAWPDLAPFFDAFPAALPPLPATMRAALKTIERFADRFIHLGQKNVGTGEGTIEAEYEVEFEKGSGMYAASLLALIIEHATHADFSFYPKPIFFRSEALEGTAVGARPV